MMSPITQIIDIHGILVRELRADTGVTDITDMRIFARKFPERMDFPAIRIIFPQAIPVSVPAPVWYTYIGDVECYAASHQEALALSREVQRVLHGLEGADIADATFSAVDSTGVESGVDEEMTPQKPQWLVAVEMTARSR